jgi:hypothetical protein
MELATGLAPNLKEVIVLSLEPGGSLRSKLPRGSWQSLPGFRRGERASLKSLSLTGRAWLRTPQIIQDWARHVDFTCLRHLELRVDHDMMSGLSGETVGWIADTQSFPHVKSLCVNVTRDDWQVEKPHYREQAISFFRTFDSLEQLSFDGSMDRRIMDDILAHHGQTLKKLNLRPREDVPRVRNLLGSNVPFHFAKDSVSQLRGQCPILEELTITVKRNKSSAS